MAHENPSSFQSEIDRRLRGQGRELPGGPGAVARRRRLLSDAFRLTRSTAPAAVDALAACQEILGYPGPVELFVHPEPRIQAAAVHGSPETPAIVVSSRLLEVFSEAELRFVLGHELGHLALEHFETASTAPDPHARVLWHYIWTRAAEASADRAGLMCARDLDAAASALFKLTTGLSSAFVKSELQAHTRQVDALLSDASERKKTREDDDTLGCFSTHAFSPPRLRSLVAFSKTRTFRRSAGSYASDEGISDEEADAVLEHDLQELEPSYLEEKSERAELMRQALAHRELVVAPLDESGAPPPSSTPRTLGAILAQLREVATLSQRARLVQHITLVRAPDGDVSDEQFLELRRVAEALSVPAWLVDEALRAATHPLD